MGEQNQATERESLLDEALLAYWKAVEAGQTPDRREWLARYPAVAGELADYFADQDRFESLASPLRMIAEPMSRVGNAGAAAPPPSVRSFGDYELLEEIGQGGMGVVFKARQKSVNRVVALKMIRAGRLASAADVARFRHEADLVAQLDHARIVPIYEVGEWPAEVGPPAPYFTMKWLDGGNLAETVASGQWQVAGKEGQRRAAQLVATIARAVHYAHQRGVLHRDLKPSNILLDGEGRPHVADFGLAKRLKIAGGVGGETELTQSGDLVGTPRFMAPEQLSGGKGPVTTATDVYGLGTILYALLTGRPPFQALTPLDALVQVKEGQVDPPRRSHPHVDRDLETICLKCLEKEPGRRYGSAEALADDLERWLHGEPIRARAVGRLERAWRWCRRNPGLAAASGLAAGALIAVVTLSISLAVVQSRAADGARRQQRATEAARRRAVIERDKYAWMTDVFYVMEDPLYLNGCVPRVPEKVGRELSVHEILERGLRNSSTRLSDQWEVRAAVLEMIGNAHRSLGNYDQAEKVLVESLKLREDHVNDIDPQDIGNSLHALGALYHEWGRLEKGDYQKAGDYYARALQIRKNRLAEDSLPYCQTLFHQAWMDVELEQYREAAQRFREVIDVRQKTSAGKDPLLSRARMGLATTQLEEAGGRYDLMGLIRVLGTLPSWNDAVNSLLELRNDSELRQAMHHFTRGLGALGGVRMLSPFLTTAEKNRQLSEAENDLQQCLLRVEKSLGKRNDYSVALLFLLAETQSLSGKRKEAERNYRECWERLGQTAGYHHLLAGIVPSGYARLMYQVGDREGQEEAHRWFKQVIEAQECRFGAGHYLVANTRMTYADVLHELKQFGRQEEQCRKALAIYDRISGRRRRLYDHCVRSLISALEAQGKVEEARPFKQRLAAASK